jgi:hypothetical protein
MPPVGSRMPGATGRSAGWIDPILPEADVFARSPWPAGSTASRSAGRPRSLRVEPQPPSGQDDDQHGAQCRDTGPEQHRGAGRWSGRKPLPGVPPVANERPLENG